MGEAHGVSRSVPWQAFGKAMEHDGTFWSMGNYGVRRLSKSVQLSERGLEFLGSEYFPPGGFVAWLKLM